MEIKLEAKSGAIHFLCLLGSQFPLKSVGGGHGCVQASQVLPHQAGGGEKTSQDHYHIENRKRAFSELLPSWRHTDDQNFTVCCIKSSLNWTLKGLRPNSCRPKLQLLLNIESKFDTAYSTSQTFGHIFQFP